MPGTNSVNCYYVNIESIDDYPIKPLNEDHVIENI